MIPVGSRSSGARARSGQRGLLRLSFERRGERLVLEDRYASAPFGAVRAHYLDGAGAPEVQITNPSGGILGGDRPEMGVDLGPGSAASHTTSAPSPLAARASASGGSYAAFLNAR